MASAALPSSNNLKTHKKGGGKKGKPEKGGINKTRTQL